MWHPGDLITMDRAGAVACWIGITSHESPTREPKKRYDSDNLHMHSTVVLVDPVVKWKA